MQQRSEVDYGLYLCGHGVYRLVVVFEISGIGCSGGRCVWGSVRDELRHWNVQTLGDVPVSQVTPGLQSSLLRQAVVQRYTPEPVVVSAHFESTPAENPHNASFGVPVGAQSRVRNSLYAVHVVAANVHNVATLPSMLVTSDSTFM
jgi:hypothetical protein